MPRTDPAKKQAILESPMFQEWWKWRRTIHPVPKDPFRAFMIDKGINAKRLEEEAWRKRVNRGDLPFIDVPFFLKSREMPSTVKKPSVPSLPPLSKLLHEKRVKTLYEAAGKFFEKYQLPKIPIYALHEKGALRSSLKVVGSLEQGTAAQIGIKGTKKQSLAALFHELGHYAAYHRKDVPLKPTFLLTPSERVAEERKAWEYAKPFLTSPQQHWMKRKAMQTYLTGFGGGKPFTQWQFLEKQPSKESAEARVEWLKWRNPTAKFRIYKVTKRGKPTGEYAIYWGGEYTSRV